MNALSLAKFGIGFGALAVASLGLLSPVDVPVAEFEQSLRSAEYEQTAVSTAHETEPAAYRSATIAEADKPAMAIDVDHAAEPSAVKPSSVYSAAKPRRV